MLTVFYLVSVLSAEMVGKGLLFGHTNNSLSRNSNRNYNSFSITPGLGPAALRTTPAKQAWRLYSMLTFQYFSLTLIKFGQLE